MIPYAREIGAAVVLAAICGAAWAGWEWRDRSADLEAAELRAKSEQVIAEFHKAERDASERARRAEQAMVGAMAAIDESYERGKADASAKSEAVVAELRAGNLRLRQHWQGAVATCDLSHSAAAARYADELAQLREEASGRIVRIGAEADAQVKALQEAYEAMRSPAP